MSEPKKCVFFNDRHRPRTLVSFFFDASIFIHFTFVISSRTLNTYRIACVDRLDNFFHVYVIQRTRDGVAIFSAFLFALILRPTFHLYIDSRILSFFSLLQFKPNPPSHQSCNKTCNFYNLVRLRGGCLWFVFIYVGLHVKTVHLNKIFIVQSLYFIFYNFGESLHKKLSFYFYTDFFIVNMPWPHFQRSRKWSVNIRGCW